MQGQCQHGQALASALFWVVNCQLLVSLHGKRGKGTSRDSFNKGANPIHEGSTLMA